MEAMAFGDTFADVEMIEGVGVGVLMANAPPDLRVRDDVVRTLSNDEDGIAVVLRERFPFDGPFHLLGIFTIQGCSPGPQHYCLTWRRDAGLVEQSPESVVFEVAEAVADCLIFLISRFIASVGPLETPPVSK